MSDNAVSLAVRLVSTALKIIIVWCRNTLHARSHTKSTSMLLLSWAFMCQQACFQNFWKIFTFYEKYFIMHFFSRSLIKVWLFSIKRQLFLLQLKLNMLFRSFSYHAFQSGFTERFPFSCGWYVILSSNQLQTNKCVQWITLGDIQMCPTSCSSERVPVAHKSQEKNEYSLSRALGISFCSFSGVCCCLWCSLYTLGKESSSFFNCYTSKAVQICCLNMLITMSFFHRRRRNHIQRWGHVFTFAKTTHTGPPTYLWSTLPSVVCLFTTIDLLWTQTVGGTLWQCRSGTYTLPGLKTLVPRVLELIVLL